jgi:hypothetical protein
VTAWSAFFSWPNGGVWSNLIAALLWSPLAAAGLTVHHVLMRRHHTREVNRQTRELKAHMDRVAAR